MLRRVVVKIRIWIVTLDEVVASTLGRLPMWFRVAPVDAGAGKSLKLDEGEAAAKVENVGGPRLRHY